MPNASRLITWLAIALFAMNASTGLAAPVLDLGSSVEIKEENINDKLGASHEDSKVPLLSIGSQSKVNRSNSAEKLKRGLTNFINQLNPAPFFVPSQPAIDTKLTLKASASGGAQSSAEPVAIVNEVSTADALVKRPNRIGQTRAIGGPLRWG